MRGGIFGVQKGEDTDFWVVGYETPVSAYNEK